MGGLQGGASVKERLRLNVQGRLSEAENKEEPLAKGYRGLLARIDKLSDAYLAELGHNKEVKILTSLDVIFQLFTLPQIEDESKPFIEEVFFPPLNGP